MKKILIFILLSVIPMQISLAEYSLSSNDQKKVEKAVISINMIIDKRGESLREKLLIKINQILNRPNLSEKNIAIFTQLRDGIDVSISAEEIEQSIKADDVKFIFSRIPNRCSSNPCKTSENFVKIEGEASNSLITAITVNDYQLKSYKGSTWEYNPNINYGNFSTGKNTYTINYIGDNGKVLFTHDFIINRIVAEEEKETTTENTQDLAGPTTPAPSAPDIIEDQEPNSPSYSVDSDIPYVDEDEVREYWRSLLNKERTLLGLKHYTYDKSLDKTAKIWSDLALKRGYIDHKVDSPGDSYYDYWKKAAWMEKNGVVCKNISRATFSESIAWNNYYCKDSSKCTQEIKKAVKRTYDFYMSEKGTDYDPHYRAIAHPLFETMGLGLTVDDLGNGKYKMYLTNHYCTVNTK